MRPTTAQAPTRGLGDAARRLVSDALWDAFTDGARAQIRNETRRAATEAEMLQCTHAMRGMEAFIRWVEMRAQDDIPVRGVDSDEMADTGEDR